MITPDDPMEDIPEGRHLSLTPTFKCACCGTPALMMTVENQEQEPVAIMKISRADSLALVATLIARFSLEPQEIVQAIEHCPDNIEALAHEARQ